MKLVVDSTSPVDDELGSMVADSAAVVKRLHVDSSAGLETIGVDVSISGDSGQLAGADGSEISDEVPSPDIVGASDVSSKLVLVTSSDICAVLVLNDSSAVLDMLKAGVFTSDESSVLDGIDGSGVSDEGP